MYFYIGRVLLKKSIVLVNIIEKAKDFGRNKNMR